VHAISACCFWKIFQLLALGLQIWPSAMKKILPIAAALFAFALPLAAQNWSVGVGSGPFVFGDFTERHVRVSTPGGTPSDPLVLTLSAATRAGALVDIERSFADRWAVRAEGSFTSSELSVKDGNDDDGIHIDAGDLDVSTFSVPLVFRINPHGTFRGQIYAGPSVAMYKISTVATATQPSQSETHDEWGGTFGAGLSWWLSDRFAIEANASDTVTTSPFEEQEDSSSKIDAKRPHNIHTALGVRWRF
jgi:hypothetical protein